MITDEFKSDKVSLLETQKEDLQFVIKSENITDNYQYIGHNTIDEHRMMFSNKDILHLIIKLKGNQKNIGYVILAGFQNPHNGIELRRIVVNEKGKGFGRASLKLIKKMVFDHFNAHRLWLDLKESNTRAFSLYMSEGFSKDGVIRECIFEDGHYISLLLLSILKEEYELDCSEDSK